MPRPRLAFGLLLIGAVGMWASAAVAQSVDANRIQYLDDFCDPYVFGLNSPRLTTPQWVGEAGVEAVVTLGIDDMRDVAGYEKYLPPILERLKQIDGRAPVSIFTCKIDPQHPRLQQWLAEGLSIETHTADHPCPCLNSKGFDVAKSTFDRCVDQMSQIPGSRPVAFRFPCCDSLNTPSPRAYVELLAAKTEAGNFVQMSSSVCSVLDAADPSLPRSLTINDMGEPRFARYAPFRNFVNRVFNYPYPFIVAHSIWEMPIGVPDDWQGFHAQQAANPRTLLDMQAYLDAVVLKQGVVNLTFHPYAWIRGDQVAALVDHADKTHGKKVKFLNFKECLQRMNANLLAGHPVRAVDGGDNGVRLLDVNHDGFMDVVIANDQRQVTRLWNPRGQDWQETPFPARIVHVDGAGQRSLEQVRMGVLDASGFPVLLVRNESLQGGWRFDGARWIADDRLLAGLEIDGQPVLTGREGRDRGVRLVDVDNDGCCELIVANPDQRAAFVWQQDKQSWRKLAWAPPDGAWIVDAQGRDAGTRWADVDADGLLDWITSSERGSSLHLFDSLQAGWARRVFNEPAGSGKALPKFVFDGKNGGAWIADRQVWLQNEETHRLTDGVFHRSFNEMLGDLELRPLSAAAGLRSLHVPPGFRVELVAAEPLVMDPVAFDWGPDGKLWVVEMADYPLGMDGKGEPGGRVRFLEDTDGDGKYDKSTLFLDKIPFPTGVMAWRDGVLVTAAPDVLFARDTDGDGKCDDRKVLFTGFGEGNQQHRINGLRWALDGWVHLANGDSGGKIQSLQTKEEVDIRSRDLRIRPDQGSLDTTTGMSQFGRDRDDFDHWFGTNNSNPGFQFVLADHYLRRNPNLAPPPPSVPVADRSMQLCPLSRTLARFNGPEAANHFTSACSGMVYRDDLLGSDVAGNFFVCEPVHNLVHREVLSRDGLRFQGTRPETERESEFLRSTDNWFRPVMIRTGPDGGLWIADMYRAVLEHPQWIPDDWEKRLDLRAGHDKGRIYRVVPVDRPLRPLAPLDKLTTPRLVAELDSPNGTQRDRVQELLYWRGDQTAVIPLEKLIADAGRPAVRLQALWTLQNLDALSDGLILQALRDSDAQVRAQAVRLAEPRLNKNPELGLALRKLSNDLDADVQLQLACSLGESNDPDVGVLLGAWANRRSDDRYFTAAVLSSINEKNLIGALDSVMKRPQSPELTSRLLTYAVAAKDHRILNWALGVILGKGNAIHGRFDHWQIRTVTGAIAELRRREMPPDKILDPDVFRELGWMFAWARQNVEKDEALLATRIVAVELLAQGTDEKDFDALASLLGPKHPAELQIGAINAIGQTRDAGSAEKLLAGWPAYSPAVRSQVLDVMLRRNAWAAALLDAIEQSVVAASEIDATRRQRLTAIGDAAIRDRASKLLATSVGARAQTVEQFQSVLTLPADTARGKEVFIKRCASCHVLEGQGHAVGADLAAVGNKSPQALLVAILDPNRAVESRYVTYLAQLEDGQIATGVLAAESGNSLTLRGPDGKDQVILRKDLEALKNTGKSLMPEGLEKDISAQELADVIAFVSGFSPAAKSFVGDQPQVVRADADEILRLTASKASISGSTLVFEPKYGNLGFWSSANDVARWSLEIGAAVKCKVVLDYACDHDAGNTFFLDLGDQQLSGTIKSTGSWDNYRQVDIGIINLTAGPHTLIFRPATVPSRAMLDLRTLRLVPVKK